MKIMQKFKRIGQKKSIYCKDNLVGPLFSIGEHTYGTPKIRKWDDSTKLTIGKYCSIADNVQIFLGGNHRTDWISTYPFNLLSDVASHRAIKGHPSSKGDITIGNDVWIGSGVTILSGVTIGDGSVIAAGAVVAKDIDPYQIAGGNPAQILKARFSPEITSRLLATQWWNLPHEIVLELVPLLLSDEVEDFLRELEDGSHNRHYRQLS